ncbi:hypothetical protein M8542_07835 [Amycolatopsis sp. OK19-0408]|uniref:Uncharacterized protein n=1 Tax=Amycolatopsis iheyensis TaxID=2945988 RepID=A0A9X2SHT5_9PSEU|nr:hypothetical protein [Amycolatopsis iheyensis]MCR6482724.1 hypothetical protein [Amycolatopsis iheyensis]
MRTWLPNNRNLGERRYWKSWLRPAKGRHLSRLNRRSKRRDYLYAAKILQKSVTILRFIDEKPPRDETAGNEPATPWIVITEVDEILRQRRLGWLARYVGACFYSICMQLDDREALEDSNPPVTEDHLGDRALHQLSMIVRNPFNSLDPDWIIIDPDLAGLRTHPHAKQWASFFALNMEAHA